MSSFLIEQWSTEKPYAIPFKESLLCSSFVKPFNTLPKQNYCKLCYHFS